MPPRCFKRIDLARPSGISLLTNQRIGRHIPPNIIKQKMGFINKASKKLSIIFFLSALKQVVFKQQNHKT